MTLAEGVAALFAHDPSVSRDPYPLYRRLIAEAPVFDGLGLPMVLVTRHRLVKEISRDATRFASARPSDAFSRFDLSSLTAEETDMLADGVQPVFALFMNSTDRPQHTRLRRAASGMFTPRRTAELGELAQRLTDDLLDELGAEDECDFLRLGSQVPLLVIMEMMGVPHADAPMLKEWGDGIADMVRSTGTVTGESVRRAHQSFEANREYVRGLAERYRRNPDRPNLVGNLLTAEEEESLSEDELVAVMIVLLFAGHETTTNLVGNGLLALLQNRDQWELLCSNPALVDSAVDELLRWDAPAQMNLRTATSDVELDGVQVPAGTTVAMLNGAANHDPEAFDEPDRLDITRRPNDHLSLGIGIHFCLGASLARLEGRIIFSTLARRFPDVELAVDPDALEWNPNSNLRGLKRLPVRLGRDRG